MNKIFALIMIMIFCHTVLKAQESVTLFDCYEKAIQNHPLGLQHEDLLKINQLNTEIINRSWLPKLDLTGKITYQSDVPAIDIDIPNVNIPSVSKDQYRAAIELHQMIYDGGMNNYRKNLENTTYQTKIKELEVEMYQIYDQINTVFFNLLTLNENIRLIEESGLVIDQRIETVKAAVDNGVLLRSELLNLKAERLKVEQSEEELRLTIESTREILSILTGIDTDSLFVELPLEIQITNDQISRPELELFEYSRQQLYAAEKLKSTEKMPKISGFGQFGYGRPGLNMLSDNFDTYYIVGMNLTWNLWDWQTVKNERQVYRIKANMIEKSETAFMQGIQIESTGLTAQIKRFEKAIARDQEIIELEEQILSEKNVQLEHGVITSTDYIAHLNNVTTARINLSNHKIQLYQAVCRYKTLRGEFTRF